MKDPANTRQPADEKWEIGHDHFVFGDFAQSTGQFRSAFAHYRLEIRATGYYKAYHGLGILLLQRRRLREARDAFRAAVRGGLRAGRRDHAALSLNNLGLALKDLGQPAKAMAAWRRAARLDPKDPTALVNLALQHLFDGDRRRGATRLEQAFRRQPRDVENRRWVGYALVKYDLDLRPGLRYLEEARAKQRPDATLLADLSMAFQKLGRMREARQAIRRAVRLDPDNADVKAQLKRLSGPAVPLTAGTAATARQRTSSHNR